MIWRYARVTATSGRDTLVFFDNNPYLLLSLVNSSCNTNEPLHCTLCIRPVTGLERPEKLTYQRSDYYLKYEVNRLREGLA